MSWPLVKVGDIFEVSSSKRVLQKDWRKKGVPFYRAREVVLLSKHGEVDNDLYIDESMYENFKDKYGVPQEGDLLVTAVGTLGQTYAVKKGDRFYFKDASVIMFRPKVRVDLSYIQHAIRSPEVQRYIQNSDGATVGTYTISRAKETEIPLPPLAEQKRIAAILDKADAICRKRQQAIDLADEFLRAVFLDMFGDPVMNPKGFPVRKLSDCYVDFKSGTKCGPFGSALKKHEYVDDGVPVWNMDNISLDGKFVDDPSLWVTDKKYKEIEAYSVMQGDVIVSRAGTVGKMGVVRSKFERSLISTNLIRVRFSNELIPEYFVSLMTYCKGRVGRLKTGPDGSFTHMNTGILDNLEFPYPSVDQQKKFIVILNFINKQKIRFGDDKVDDLFGSLSQKAFSGEL